MVLKGFSITQQSHLLPICYITGQSMTFTSYTLTGPLYCLCCTYCAEEMLVASIEHEDAQVTIVIVAIRHLELFKGKFIITWGFFSQVGKHYHYKRAGGAARILEWPIHQQKHLFFYILIFHILCILSCVFCNFHIVMFCENNLN